MLNCATLLLAASVTFGQPAPTASFEDFQTIGDWMTGTSRQVNEDSPQGSYTMYAHSEWTLDKHAIIGKFSTDEAGKDVVYTAMLVWDGAAKQIRHMGVTTRGVVIMGTWYREDGAAVLKYEAIEKNGTNSKHTARYNDDGTIVKDGQPAGKFERMSK